MAASKSGGQYSIFSEAELAELPNSDPPQSEGMNSETACTVDNSSPLTVADYGVCSVETWDGILIIEEITPELRHSLPDSSPQLLNHRDGIEMIEEVTPDVRHLLPNSSTRLVENRDGIGMIEEVNPEGQHSLPYSSAQLLDNSFHVRSVNFVSPNDVAQEGPSVPVSGGPSRQDQKPPEIVQMAGKAWRFLFSKQLTKTDCRGTLKSTGIIFLPKKEVTLHFPNLEGASIGFFDLDLKRTWTTTLKFENRPTPNGPPIRKYCLHQARELISEYALQEGSRLDIYKAESESDASYALRVVK